MPAASSAIARLAPTRPPPTISTPPLAGEVGGFMRRMIRAGGPPTHRAGHIGINCASESRRAARSTHGNLNDPTPGHLPGPGPGHGRHPRPSLAAAPRAVGRLVGCVLPRRLLAARTGSLG